MQVICPKCGTSSDEALEHCLVCNEALPQPSTSGSAGIENAVARSPETSEAELLSADWRLIPKDQGELVEALAIPLRAQRLVLGRFDESSGPVDIELSRFPQGETTSRNHAVLEFADGCWRLIDTASSNGVFVRKAGQERFSAKIVEPTAVGNGDEIGLGMLIFLLRGP
jgi:FHA domain